MRALSIAGFTNLGYRLHARGFDEDESADLSGRSAIVTGATGGIGLAAATGLSRLGARVLLVGRSEERLERAQRQVPGSVAYRCDLSLMAEIRRLADLLLADNRRIELLVNNVGVLFPRYTVTSEGVEATLATNLAGHFLLTNLLLARLAESAPARVVNVSSGGMYAVRIQEQSLFEPGEDYRGSRAYAQTKRGQVILTEMWAERLSGTGIVVHAMHPGWVKTEGVRTSLPTFNTLLKPLLRSPEQGADTVVWLSSSAQAEATSGGFWFDRSPAPIHLREATRETTADRGALWQGLAELTSTDVPPMP